MAETTPITGATETMVLTTAGLETLVKAIFDVVNERIGERIVDTVSENDTTHSPAAATVYQALRDVKHILPLVIESGDITTASIEKDTKTLYVVRKSDTAKEAVPYIWVSEEVGFVAVCSLSSVPENADFVAMDNATIQSAVTAAANNSKPNLTPAAPTTPASGE